MFCPSPNSLPYSSDDKADVGAVVVAITARGNNSINYDTFSYVEIHHDYDITYIPYPISSPYASFGEATTELPPSPP